MKFIIILFFSFTLTFALIQFVKKGMVGRDWVYPAVLAVLPFFYFIFALWINDKTVLKNEVMMATVFFIIVAVYLKYRFLWAEYLLVAGFFLHAFYDVGHDWFFTNMGVPQGWALFCGSLNVFVGIYLMLHLKKHQTLSINS